MIALAPMPPAERFFGHARELAHDPLGTLVRWMNEHGPLVRFRVGRRIAHVAFGADLVRRVVSDPDGVYGKDTHGYRTLSLFVGQGLLTSDGERWVRGRRALQPAFHKRAVLRQIAIMEDEAARSARDLARSRGPVRLDDVAMRTTLAIVGRALLGEDLNASADAIASAIADLQVAANRRITSALVLPFAVPSPEHLRIRRARGRLRSLLGARVDARIARGTQGSTDDPDALDLLLATRDGGTPLGREEILDELVTLLVAGHESTANALTWAVLLLLRHPAELARVRAEVDAGGNDLPLLRAAIDETLRLFPPGWSFGRAPRVDDELGGYTVPAGHLVMIAPYASHRSAVSFPDPERFDPSRFAAGPPPPFTYLPFGGGPRTCIGHAFAKAETAAVLAAWLRAVDFTLVPGQDLTPLPLVTLRPRSGLVVRVSPRWS